MVCFAKLRNLGSCLLVFGLGLPAFASPLQRERGAGFYLNAEGFAELSSQIKRELLDPIYDAPLPDIDENGDYGVRVKASGLRYSVKFSDFRITPRDHELYLELDIEDASLFVDKFTASKKVIFDVSASCWDTRIKIGEQTAVRLIAKLPLGVTDNQIQVAVADVDFEIAEHDYRIYGPARCSGKLGVDRLLKMIANKVLRASKKRIGEAIERKVRDTTPYLSELLNHATHQAFPFHLGAVPGVPAQQGAILTAPARIELDPNGLFFQLAVDFAKDYQVPTQDKMLDQWSRDEQVLGHVGLNPMLLHDLWREFLAENLGEIEINKEIMPQADDYLSRKILAAIWPDLDEQILTADKLKLFIQIKAVPSIELSTRKQNIQLTMSDVRLRFQIKQDDEWIDYFHIQLEINAFSKLALVNKQLAIALDKGSSLEVAGRWDENYTPKNQLFEKEVFEMIFTTLIDYLYASGPLYQVTLPSLPMGDGELSFAKIRLEKPYINIDVVKG